MKNKKLTLTEIKEVNFYVNKSEEEKDTYRLNTLSKILMFNSVKESLIKEVKDREQIRINKIKEHIKMLLEEDIKHKEKKELLRVSIPPLETPKDLPETLRTKNKGILTEVGGESGIYPL